MSSSLWRQWLQPSISLVFAPLVLARTHVGSGHLVFALSRGHRRRAGIKRWLESASDLGLKLPDPSSTDAVRTLGGNVGDSSEGAARRPLGGDLCQLLCESEVPRFKSCKI